MYGLLNCAISDDLEWPSRVSSRSFTYCKPFQMRFFVFLLCSSWQEFNWRTERRAVPSSVIVERLV